MTLREMMDEIMSSNQNCFSRVAAVDLHRRSLKYEQGYQLHLCPVCSSVNVDIIETGGLFRGTCYTCGFQGEQAADALTAMKLWNEERIES